MIKKSGFLNPPFFATACIEPLKAIPNVEKNKSDKFYIYIIKPTNMRNLKTVLNEALNEAVIDAYKKLYKGAKNSLLEYSSPNAKSIIGYRNVKSSDKGKYGTFYNVKKPNNYQTKEVVLMFKKPLIVTDKDVYNFEGLSLEYLFWKWFPNIEDTYAGIAKKQGIETSELIDKMVTKEAIKRGYDGIIMGDLEIVDLTTHVDF